MTLSPEMEKAICDGVIQEVANRVWQQIESSLDDVICVSIPRASGALDVSTAQAHKLINEFVDLGPRDKRVTLTTLKRLVAERAVSTKKKR